jgi:hypothetical protein
LTPAALYVRERDDEALTLLESICQHMPPMSERDSRAKLLALVMMSLAEAADGGHFQRDEEARAAMLESWLSACKVSETDLAAVVNGAPR